MKLIDGTYSPSKLESMRQMIAGLDIELEGLRPLDIELEEAEENGKEPILNATQKAMTYYKKNSQTYIFL